MTEKQEQAAIVKLLHMLGGQVWVLGTRRPKGDYPGTRQTPGLPDLIAAIPRGHDWRRVEIEVKAARGRVSPAQRHYRSMADACGIDHLLGGLDVIIAWLEEQGYVIRRKVK